MNLDSIEIDESVDEDVVQFVKHLEENIDPSGEYDCTVKIATVRYDEQGDLPGDDIPTGSPDPDLAEWGVQVSVDFVDNSDCPNHRVSDLAKSFFGYGNYSLHAHFDGGAGEYEAYIFEIV